VDGHFALISQIHEQFAGALEDHVSEGQASLARRIAQIELESLDR
jgi:hypothetical protein